MLPLPHVYLRVIQPLLVLLLITLLLRLLPLVMLPLPHVFLQVLLVISALPLLVLLVTLHLLVLPLPPLPCEGQRLTMCLVMR